MPADDPQTSTLAAHLRGPSGPAGFAVLAPAAQRQIEDFLAAQPAARQRELLAGASADGLLGLAAGPAAAGERAYTVQRGDTLGAIAQRHGVRLAAVIRANAAISDPDRIYPGQRVVIPA